MWVAYLIYSLMGMCFTGLVLFTAVYLYDEQTNTGD